MSAIDALSSAIKTLTENVRSERGVINSGIRDNDETRQAIDTLINGWAQVVAERDRLQAIISGEFPEGCTPADAMMLRKANHGLADENYQLRAMVAELEKLKQAAIRVVGEHSSPNDCYATGPLTGDPFADFVECPSCTFLKLLEADNG